ncbi:hypothetical protein GQX74_008933 [Glossina fuscipes]|nr:hypothetical protein GQX74_008933 [Glossina fuscipes]
MANKSKSSFHSFKLNLIMSDMYPLSNRIPQGSNSSVRSYTFPNDVDNFSNWGNISLNKYGLLHLLLFSFADVTSKALVLLSMRAYIAITVTLLIKSMNSPTTTKRGGEERQIQI